MRGQHRKPTIGEVDLGVPVGVGVVLFEVEVALVVEHAVEHEGARRGRCTRPGGL